MNEEMTFSNLKVAIIADWIKDMGGAEVVLEHFIEIFPEADIYTSVFFGKNNSIFKNKNIQTSFIQKVPFLNKNHKLALKLRPLAFESFDLSKYDLVISSSSAESKGVITKPDCLQICYCHTPTRYFWSHYQEYKNMKEFGLLNPIANFFMSKIIHKLRAWDFLASKRPDFFIANSINTKKRIKKYYNRESKVIYPGINLNNFIFSEKKENFYLYVGRCIPYKKFDLIVDSFNKNGKKIIICTNTENNLYKKLKLKSKENIIWKLNLDRKELANLFSKSKGFIFPPEEDFGLVPIESMASGTPVIGYKKGGALETIIDKKTGIFFEEQNIYSLNNAIEKFETLQFDYKEIRKQAEKFNKEIFKNEIRKFIKNKLNIS